MGEDDADMGVDQAERLQVAVEGDDDRRGGHHEARKEQREQRLAAPEPHLGKGVAGERRGQQDQDRHRDRYLQGVEEEGREAALGPDAQVVRRLDRPGQAQGSVEQIGLAAHRGQQNEVDRRQGVEGEEDQDQGLRMLGDAVHFALRSRKATALRLSTMARRTTDRTAA